MVQSRAFEPPDLVTAVVVGTLTTADQQDIVGFINTSIAASGPVRVMVRLQQFAGWQPGTQSDGAPIWLHDDARVECIAIVGERHWKVPVLTMLAQPVRRIPIAYFETVAAAQGWLDAHRPAAASTRRAS